MIARARRRMVWNAITVEGARAVCLSLGILVLLLLLGTDILDWRYLLFIPITTMVGGTCLTWRRIPGLYETAQILDRRLGLHDAISTALFYRPGHTSRIVDEGMRQAQHAQALPLAAAIDLRNALPLRMPRLIYAGAALALIGGGLVGLRYRVQGGLDLRAPATPSIAFLIQSVTQQVANLEEWLRQLEPELQRGDQGTKEAKLTEKDASGTDPNSRNPAEAGRGDEPGVEKPDSKMALDDPPAGQRDAAGDEQAGNEGNSPQQSDRLGKQGEQGREQRSSANQGASSEGSESSLLNKVRDTMANLLSAMKPQSGGRGGTRAEMDRTSPKKDGKSDAGERQQDGQGSPSQADELGDGSPGRKDASPSSGQATGAGADKQLGTGAGQNEGDKELRLAEQRAAMGKISVILGKRSKEVTGDTSMEVVSGEQTLQTRYQSRQAKHAGVEDTGERDEVPIELQSYVRRYLQAAKAGASRNETSGTKQK
ncbi:MAG TPA: hypothetical protein VNV86_11280 [Candidatus Acidoferrum sp.]|nr:hypothetical protein [Candidatus Acidoferrum sp.]